MKNIIIKKQMSLSKKYDNVSKEQVERQNQLFKQLHPVYSRMNATHLLKKDCLDKIFQISAEISENSRNWSKGWYEHPVLKPFHNSYRWQLLDYVVNCSANHKIVYQQDIAYELKVSVKTVYASINEFIDSGHFIKMAPAIGEKHDKRVVNIRPSVEVVVAYLDVHLEHILNSVDFLKKHTKFIFN
tara:strand:+ start:1735 stop:2292 length:558 start_codon:yes stop_codon:yes gene_type:complete